MIIELSERPLFDELQPLFHQMSLNELRKAADWLVTFASNEEIDEEQEHRRVDAEYDSPQNVSEKYPGVVTYPTL